MSDNSSQAHISNLTDWNGPFDLPQFKSLKDADFRTAFDITLNRDKEQIVVPNTIWCDVSKVGRMHEWLETISSKKARRRLIRTGVDTVNRFCRTQQNR